MKRKKIQHNLTSERIEAGIRESYGSYTKLADMWLVTPMDAKAIVEDQPKRLRDMFKEAASFREDLVISQLLNLITEGDKQAIKLYVEQFIIGKDENPDIDKVIKLVEAKNG